MKSYLKENLYSKHKISFNKEGKIKILMFSDIQERAKFDSQTLKNINTMLDNVKPDMVILGGDQCMGPDVQSQEEFVVFLDQLAEPLESRKIPWMHIFGNHDYDLNFNPYIQQSLYERFDYCISKHTSDISGVTNFMIPVYKYNSDEIGFNIWGLDTQNRGNSFIDEFVSEFTDIDNRALGLGRYDLIRFDQMMWYWNSSIELENYLGKKTPSLMCMHIAPVEFAFAINNPQKCKLKGFAPERLDSGILNCGIFSEILQRGDVKFISCGHTHRNNFEASYCGIKMFFDSTAGLTCYGEEQTRGGRVFEINQNNTENIVSYPYFYFENK